MVLVGALNMSSIILNFDNQYCSNLAHICSEHRKYCSANNTTNAFRKRNCYISDTNVVPQQNCLSALKGMELGMLKLGSTVVILFECHDDRKF